MNQSSKADQNVPAKAPTQTATAENRSTCPETALAWAATNSRLATPTSSVGSSQFASRGGLAATSSKTSPGHAKIESSLEGREVSDMSDLSDPSDGLSPAGPFRPRADLAIA